MISPALGIFFSLQVVLAQRSGRNIFIIFEAYNIQVELIEKYGYIAETHYITTEDGYILTTHRIPKGKLSTKEKPGPAVLIMHGLLSSSSDFLNMGSNRSLGFFLSDSGFDVWIANARGNTYSKNHTTLNPSKNSKEFYDFSFQEIGYYDLPALIDYILKLKGDESLHYIGHSQGTTAYLVMGQARPEYNKKIRLASLLAPVAFMEHIQNPVFLLLSPPAYFLETTFNFIGLYQLPLLGIIRAVLPKLCSAAGSISNDLCASLYWFLGSNLDDRPLKPDYVIR